jgi:hypothetical protein
LVHARASGSLFKRNALRRRLASAAQHRSTHDNQYASSEFQPEFTKCGVHFGMCRKGNCWFGQGQTTYTAIQHRRKDRAALADLGDRIP